MKKPAYDFYEKKIRKETAEHFRKLCEMEEAETPKEQETLRINTDYTPECIDRRIRATSRYLSKAEECFKIFMPFAKAKDLFFRFNTLPFSSQAYGSEDFKETVSLAASIWILDQLLIQAQLCEGGSLPPVVDPYMQESDYSRAENHCRIWHPVYSDEIIDMYYVGTRYYGGGSFSKEDSQSKLLQNQKPLAQILPEYIDVAVIDAAIEKFENRIWDFYALAGEAVYLAESALADRAASFQRKIQDRTSAVAESNRSGASLFSAASKLNPNCVNLSPASLQQFRCEEQSYDKFRNQVSTIYSYLLHPGTRKSTLNSMRTILPVHLRNAIMEFLVDDPYETCFAVWYLLATGSDIPWLWYGSLATAFTAFAQLDFSPYKRNWSYERTVAVGEGTYKPALSADEEADVIGKANFMAPFSFGTKTLGRKIYNYSAGLVPRIIRDKADVDHLIESLRASDQYDEAFRTLAYIVCARKEWIYASHWKTLLAKDEDENEPQEISDETPEEKIARLEKEVAVLKERCRGLRMAAHEEEKRASQAEKKLTEAEATAERYRLELADLQDIAFMTENGVAEEPASGKTFSFPIHTRKKIVSFGGHPSWRNAIRELLPDVKFIAPDMVPNEDLVRSADEIWFQPNCISHADYYKIIGISRRCGIPIRYFKYAGAESCAVQFANTHR